MQDTENTIIELEITTSILEEYIEAYKNISPNLPRADVIDGLSDTLEDFMSHTTIRTFKNKLKIEKLKKARALSAKNNA